VIAAFADDSDVQLGKMFSSSYVMKVNGRIFAMLIKSKFVAKLPRERVDELIKRGVGQHFDPGHGRLMKEWVTVEAEGEAWVDLAKEAYRFVKDANGNESFAVIGHRSQRRGLLGKASHSNARGAGQGDNRR
jgi:hypothetical protein